jgi:hypothetical protein
MRGANLPAPCCGFHYTCLQWDPVNTSQGTSFLLSRSRPHALVKIKTASSHAKAKTLKLFAPSIKHRDDDTLETTPTRSPTSTAASFAQSI